MVAEAYGAYQAALLHAELYDTPGLYWQAVLIGNTRKPALLEGVDAIVLDGFDDFTPSEFRLLHVLEKHTQDLVFGINHDNTPDRKDLYALSKTTIDRLHQEFDVLPVSAEAPGPSRFSGYAAANIFWRDRPVWPKRSSPT